MAVIDAHVHLYPPEVGADPEGWARDRDEKHWAVLCTRRRRDGSPVQLFPRVDELLRDMDRAGVDRSVLLGWYWEHGATCRAQNRFYAECVRTHPDRLSAFGVVHPADGAAALDEIRRFKDEGLIGLGELSPHSQRIVLSEPSWLAVLQLAGELGLPVNLHVTDPAAPAHPGRIETDHADFLGFATRFPQTTLILAHWGGGLAFKPECRALTNLYFDTAASPLLYKADVWRRGVEAVGADRLLFGSDNPLRLYPKVIEGVGLAELVAEARRELNVAEAGPLLGANAIQLLDL